MLYALSLIHSDAADEEDSVDLGGRRIIKKKKKEKKEINYNTHTNEINYERQYSSIQAQTNTHD